VEKSLVQEMPFKEGGGKITGS